MRPIRKSPESTPHQYSAAYEWTDRDGGRHKSNPVVTDEFDFVKHLPSKSERPAESPVFID